ncbi:rod shape-determining protein MreC [Streptomyces sp. ITFR-16]|uniref:rod shape-determining protein MreC n=1 Tax=Streptomyces sp. ITFR-16 TaxID=3075198 RepID=UPI00288A5F83|nr:rod shape-determining protein MreC [Streptomyces sp. ITFR-16]WNI21270.1 rod shape-determining protein MreC [Streptomyces sp. ITFR-16]
MRAAHGGRFGGATRGLALDLGSSRTRVWIPGQGVVADTGSGPDGAHGTGRPVRRGRIVDRESCGRMLARIAETALGADRGDTVIVLSHPVLAGSGHRAEARELLRALGPGSVVVLDSARAAAAYAGPGDGGPLLVVDIGAELTEATLLVDGRVRDARLAETGLSDLEPGEPPTALVRAALDMVMAMWRQDRHGALLGALRRGPLLAGGGALRPDVTHRIAVRLGVPVRLGDDPATTVVRGAGLVLGSVLRHGSAAPALPGRSG